MGDMPAPMVSLSIGGVVRYATCWELTRADGEVFRFTDHNRTITIEGNEYSPVGSFRSSARQREEGLRPQNMEASGPLVVEAINDTDLRAGRFRRARLREMVVDWMYPWMGFFRQNYYVIPETKWNGESWTVSIEGILALMRVRIGSNYTKKCRWQELADSNCQASLTGLTQTGRAVSTIVRQRKKFTSTITTGRGDGYFNDGELTWTSGDNLGFVHDVKVYLEASGVVELQIATPFDIAASDQFTIKPGCDRREITCKQKFNNFNRFGGFPYIPGNDDFFQTPSANQ